MLASGIHANRDFDADLILVAPDHLARMASDSSPFPFSYHMSSRGTTISAEVSAVTPLRS